MAEKDRSLILGKVIAGVLSLVFVTLIVFAPLIIICVQFEGTEEVLGLPIAAAISFALMLLFLFGPLQASRSVFTGVFGTNGVGAVVIIGMSPVLDYVNEGYATLAVAMFFLSAIVSLLALALPERLYEGRVGSTFAAVSLSYMTDALMFVLMAC